MQEIERERRDIECDVWHIFLWSSEQSVDKVLWLSAIEENSAHNLEVQKVLGSKCISSNTHQIDTHMLSVCVCV